jgi:hypothetical protein
MCRQGLCVGWQRAGRVGGGEQGARASMLSYPAARSMKVFAVSRLFSGRLVIHSAQGSLQP